LLKKRPRIIDVDGDKFTVRALTVAETIKMDGLKDGVEAMNFILSRGAVDETGESIFVDESDVTIADVPADLAVRLTKEIVSLSKTGKFAALEKNLDATP
jgi:hypothetical protein